MMKGAHHYTHRHVDMAPLPKPRRRSCKCGICNQCVEDARWERIFAEKFEDKDYYRRPVSPSFGSTLADPNGGDQRFSGLVNE